MACAECFQGTTHNGTPTGHVSRIHDLDVYVSWPNGHEPASRGIIVVIPDAFGWSFINNRLLADRLAEKSGLRVYLPDFMRGKFPVSLLSNWREAHIGALLRSPSPPVDAQFHENILYSRGQYFRESVSV